MLLYSQKPSRPFIGFILFILLLPLIFVAGRWGSENLARKDYQNKAFQEYENRYRYCSSFRGGTDKSQEAIYEMWQDKKTFGC